MRRICQLIIFILATVIGACDLTDSPPEREGRFTNICQVGCTYRSFASALNVAVDGDTLGILAPLLVESGLRIDHDIRLLGMLDGEAVTIIAGATDRAVDVPVLTVNVGASVVMEDLIIERGTSGLVNIGEVRMLRCLIRSNLGNGIRNTGTMWIDESTIVDNAGQDGAGIHNLGMLEISQSTIAFNTADRGRGAGILNEPGGVLMITQSRIANNAMQVAGSGGGLFV